MYLIYWSTCSLIQSGIAEPLLVCIFKESGMKQSKNGVFFVNVSASSLGRTLGFQDVCAIDTGWSTFKLFTWLQNNWTTSWFYFFICINWRHCNSLTVNRFQNFTYQNEIENNCFVINGLNLLWILFATNLGKNILHY